MPIVWVKPTIESHKEKFLSRVKRNEETGCLEWTHGLTTTGYGQFAWGHLNNGPMTTTAHRAAWWLFKGEVPAGMHILHKCNNRKCVEWSQSGHLYLGDQQRNMWDLSESGRQAPKYKNFDWRESRKMADKILSTLGAETTVEQCCKILDIGRTTFYRIRNHYPEIRTKISENKRIHKQRGSRASKMAKWKDELMPMVLEEIMVGGNMRVISHRLNITPLTLRRWADRFPQIAIALSMRPG